MAYGNDQLEVFEDGELPDDVYARVLIFGPSGAGKTTLASTAPGPRLVIASDHNCEVPLRVTLAQLPRIYTPEGEQSRKPTVYLRPRDSDQLLEAISRTGEYINTHGIRTVIFDSITSVSEMLMQEILEIRNDSLARSGRGRRSVLERLDKNGYGILNQRLSNIRNMLHKLPVHVVWTAGFREPYMRAEDGSDRRGGPDIPGQQSRYFPSQTLASLYVEQSLQHGERHVQVRTCVFNDIDAKDNTGRLQPIEPPDLYVLFARMGYLTPGVAAAVEKAVPRMSKDAMHAALEGVAFG